MKFDKIYWGSCFFLGIILVCISCFILKDFYIRSIVSSIGGGLVGVAIYRFVKMGQDKKD